MQDSETDISARNIGNYVPYVYSQKANNAERPRILKSHETYQPKYPRVIYLVRDGRDVAVSYYNFYQTTKGYVGSFDKFVRQFLSGNVQFGSWQDHVRSWLLRQHANPFMVVRYEQLHRHPFNILRQVAEFLHLDVDDGLIGKAVQKHTFENRKKDARNNSPFYGRGFRGGVKGAPGAWKETFTTPLLDLFWSQAAEAMEQLGYNRDGD